MAATQKTFAYGTLEENGDTWFLMTRDRMIFLDAALSDLSLEHRTVSVIGTMGIPPASPGITKLIVENIAPHEAIAIRAYEIYRSGQGGSSDDHWYRAERELLGL
jgi:Protein of unknown function (DUF2934)